MDGEWVEDAPRRPHSPRRPLRLAAITALAMILTGTPAGLARADTTDPSTLRRSLTEQTRQVSAAEAELIAQSRAAAVALEAFSLAVQRQQLAQAEQERRRQAVAAAEAQLAERRADLGRWARQTYHGGNALGANPTLAALLGEDTDDLAHQQRFVTLLGQENNRAVAAVTAAIADRRQAAQAADDAAAAGQRAVLAAQDAKQARDAAVRRQRAALDQLRAQLQDTRDAVAEAERQARLLAQARALAAASAGSGPQHGDNRITGAVGTCAGGDMQLYANGEIPLEALCPLWSAPGHYLRADAAYAFDQLAAEYGRSFGKPLCVTDSYRSYAEQVRVKAEKPSLAATPGTSNHGWGTAVDLCGGIQDFDSAQHRWMILNAPAFGWFHPGWAERTGTMPEPWHWEFAG
ncbi:MAG: M15 family metallopeptidase [Kineosporiaceae bacterium]